MGQKSSPLQHYSMRGIQKLGIKNYPMIYRIKVMVHKSGKVGNNRNKNKSENNSRSLVHFKNNHNNSRTIVHFNNIVCDKNYLVIYRIKVMVHKGGGNTRNQNGSNKNGSNKSGSNKNS